MSEDQVFAALADPTRREVLSLVAAGRATSPTELAGVLPVTRQAVAKHLAVLERAGLVDGARAGRETHYRATPAPLADAIAWMTTVGAEWDDRLAALERVAQRRRG